MLRRIGPLLLTVQLITLSAAPGLHGATTAPPRAISPRRAAVVPQRLMSAPRRSERPASSAATLRQGAPPATNSKAAEIKQPLYHGRPTGLRAAPADVGPLPSISFSDQNQDPEATPCIAAPTPTHLVVPGDTLLVAVNGFAAATPLTISINNTAPVVYAAPVATASYTVPSGVYTDTAFLRVTDGTTTVTEALIVGAVLTVSTTIGDSAPSFSDSVQVHDSTGSYDVSSGACTPSGSTPLVARFAVPPDSHLEVTTAPYVNAGAAVAYAPISADVVISGVNPQSVSLNYDSLDPYTINGMVTLSGLPTESTSDVSLNITGLNDRSALLATQDFAVSDTQNSFSYVERVPAAGSYDVSISTSGSPVISADKGATVSSPSTPATVNFNELVAAPAPSPTTTPGPTDTPTTGATLRDHHDHGNTHPGRAAPQKPRRGVGDGGGRRAGVSPPPTSALPATRWIPLATPARYTR